MASDSQATYKGIKTRFTKKIHRLKSGGLLGCAGDTDVRDLIALVNEVKTIKGLPSGDKLAELGLDTSAILILPKGDVISIELDPPANSGPPGTELTLVEDQFWSVGTGSHIAIGAMEAGKSAVEAVRIACKYDIYSSLPTIKIEL